MIDVAYVRTMAAYNRWQNENLYGAADTLSDGQRREERGAFFGSVHGTLSHLLWADQTWLNRFGGTPKPAAATIAESKTMVRDWDDLKHQRVAFDGVIIAWADALDPEWLKGQLVWYSGAMKREATGPRDMLVVHLFNHQTHHRGQVHCLLTELGAKPRETDIWRLPS